MSIRRDSSGVSIDSTTPLTYYDAALGIFDRSQSHKLKKAKTLKPHKAKASEHIIEKAPTVTTQPLEVNGSPWNPGFFRQLPITGALALFVVLLCAGADAVILYKSDGQEVESWKISPAVLLATLSAVANTCLQFARSEGVIIAWWRKALHGGTLYDLNRYWESGDSVRAAAMPGRGFNLVALATITAQIVIIDGPLLQRASHVVVVPRSVMVNVTAPIAQELPYGYTGYADNPTDIVMNETFSQIVNAYIKREKITTSFFGCSGNCSGIVKAAGLAVDCSENSTVWKTSNSTGPDFSSDFLWIPQDYGLFQGVYANGTNPWPAYPFIDFKLGYITGRQAAPAYWGSGTSAAHGPCNGTMTMKRCTMRSATLHYPITMVENTVSIIGNSSSFFVDHIQPVGTVSKMIQGDINVMTFSTLGGVALAAQNMFNSVGTGDGFKMSLKGSVASQYIDYGVPPADFFTTQDSCATNWADPTSDIVDALNEIMFRTALVAADFPRYSLLNGTTDEWWTSFYESAQPDVAAGDNGMPLPQLLSMRQTSNVTIFRSNYSYLAAALAVMVLGVLVVIPTFHGFWELGRETSLNPLEIAKAFNADLLNSGGSNSSAHNLAREARNVDIQYGEVFDDCHSTGFATGAGHETSIRGPRLGIANPNAVTVPRNRVVYL